MADKQAGRQANRRRRNAFTTNRKPHADVSSVEPAFFVQRLGCLLGVAVVALHHVAAFTANLSPTLPLYHAT